MSNTNGLSSATGARHVQRDDNNGVQGKNTQHAYGPKGAEFLQYCTSVFGYLAYPKTVTEEKVFDFLFYQAYRTHKKRGGRQRGTQQMLFDVDDYNSVMAKYREGDDDIDRESLLKTEVNTVGFSTVNQYLCSILQIFLHQLSQNANNLTKADIRSERVSRLLRLVEARNKKIKQKRVNKKKDHALPPLGNPSIGPSMELALQGVRDQLDTIQAEVRNVSQDVKSLVSQCRESIGHPNVVNNQLQRFVRHMGSFQPPPFIATEATIGAADTNPPPSTKTLFRNHTSVSSMWSREQRTIFSNQGPHILRHMGSFQPPSTIATEATIGAADTNIPKTKRMLFRNHKSVSSMWNEWHGLGDFESDEYPGGIEGLEQIDNRWRKHFSTAEQKHFSRLKCIIHFVKEGVTAGESLVAILKEGDDLMKTKRTLSSVHVHLKQAKSFRLNPNELIAESSIDL